MPITEISLWQAAVVAIAGFLCGVINTLAGSGSLVTLPVLMFVCGLPAPVANGTNRIGMLFQTVAGMLGLKKNGVPFPADGAWIVVPAVLGALVGAWLAVDISEQAMQHTIAGLMVFMFFFLLIDQKKWLREEAALVLPRHHPALLLTYFAVGAYGGFIQAGVGIFLTAAVVLAGGLTLKQSLPVKILGTFFITVPSLLTFAIHGQVNWGIGLLMAIFQGIGAWFAVNFVVKLPDASRWIYRLLLVIVALSALKAALG